ncbi:MAG: KamA family radical SAM protein [candidate division KSB1 bacterium]|jgi:lysine 2,3-aminomutase|nr:KamA family radical SAM protein [candidate division KSB1 bacterium]
MESWKHLLRESLSSPEAIAHRFNLPLEDVRKINSKFKIKITPYYANLIKEKGDPLYRQMVPDIAELDTTHGKLDPLAEDKDSPVPGIVHRYPDRALFLVSAECASYCRFCTRKRKVGNHDKIRASDIDTGIEYIRNHHEIRDIIISGGDPLMLSDERLESILKKLRGIPHIEILRIGSRVPCVLPQRVTPDLVDMLKKYHPLFMNVHFNHPDEITDESSRALNLLSDAGIPLGNQSVLLKGVNDDPETMKRLMQKLLKARVRPYYIYQADIVLGTEHFRTRVEKGLEIIKAIRGWTSGLAVPQFVIDAPGGGGKIPLLPEYVLFISDSCVMMRNYEGNVYTYSQPSISNGDEYTPVRQVDEIELYDSN